MRTAPDLRDRHIVRLNAELFPVGEYEMRLYDQYKLEPVLVEAGTPEEILQQAADCDALIVVSAELPATVVKGLDSCQIISRRGTGTDRIDVETATRCGIVVTNVPDFCTEEMADHAMALLLASARRLPQMSQAMTEGAWSWARQQAVQSHRLSGQVLGLVGFGRGAQAVARRARAFGMRLLATRRHLDAPSPEAHDLGVELARLDTLLARSDYVSLHLPLNAETYHLLDDAVLRRMKPGAYLINTARGAIVDETALVAALREGRLAGAGIDTFEGIDVFTAEEGLPDHPLLGLDNVVLTPHVAANSVEAGYDVSRGAIENVAVVLSGRWPPPDRVVNPEVVPRWRWRRMSCRCCHPGRERRGTSWSGHKGPRHRLYWAPIRLGYDNSLYKIIADPGARSIVTCIGCDSSSPLATRLSSESSNRSS